MGKNKVLILFLSLIFGGFFCTSAVFADNYGIGGTVGPSYDFGGTTISAYNCQYVATCPRWILVNKSTYDAIRNGGSSRQVGSYSSLPACEGDDRVMIAGNINNNLYILYNINAGNQVFPTKKSHIYTSIEGGPDYNCYSYNGDPNADWCPWTDRSNLDRQNAFATIGPRTGKNYSQILTEVLQKSGQPEENIAVFCESMVISQYVLTLKSIDKNGNSLSSVMRDRNYTYNAGTKASISRFAEPGYTFLGFATSIGNGRNGTFVTTENTNSSAYVSGDSSPKETYNVKSLTSNITVYAVYERQQRTLTAKAVDVNGNAISAIADVVATKSYGDKASVTRGANDAYTFKGWKVATSYSATKNASYVTSTDTNDNAYLSGSSTPKETYNVKSLTNNAIVYAVYEKQKRTLTAYAGVEGTYNASTGSMTYIKSDGTQTNDRNASWKNAVTVDYGSSATVSTEGFDPAGFTWAGWSTECKENEKNGRKCTRSSLTTNGIIIGLYNRNQFRAWGGVSAGSTYDDNATKLSTNGYVDEADNTGSPLRVDCESASGCSVAFRFDLKTLSRGGSTTYQIERKVDSGAWGTVSDGGPFTKSPSKDGERVYQKAETIGIDKTVCYRITYKPFGGYSDNTTKSVSLCAYVVPSFFEGKSDITGSVSKTTNWKNTNTTEVGYIQNCSPTDGCKVTFEHRLKRTQGIGGTTYSVSRESNLVTSTRAISAGTIKNSTTFNSGTETVVSTSQNLTLYPGMVVCEKLTFKPSNKSNSSDVYTNICASALGNAQPDDASGANALVDINVMNNRVEKYHNFQKTVYAKPTDQLIYRATYSPNLQYTYNLIPQAMRIDGGTIKTGNGSSSLGAMFNANKGGSLRNWNNAFSVQKSTQENFASSSLIRNYNDYALGQWRSDNGGAFSETNTYVVQSSNAGQIVYEKAITNLNTNVRTTPSQVTFAEISGKNTANVITQAKSDVARAIVPYNYQNSTRITTDPESTTIYAGEEFTLSYDYIVGIKSNSLTTDSSSFKYATTVADARWKVKMKVGKNGPWVELNETEKKGNISVSGGSALTGQTEQKQSELIIPDVAAGTQICFKSMIYPQNSGADDSLEAGGNKRWVESSSDDDCFTVAKKPSLQVWGGNVYSAGSINTALSRKHNLLVNKDNGEQIQSSDGKVHLFGSWGELGSIVNGVTTGFASGASLGYAENNDGVLNPNPVWNENSSTVFGGATEDSKRFPLSFANSVGSPEPLGNSVATNSMTNDKSSIISKYMRGYTSQNVISGDDGLVFGDDRFRLDDGKTYYYYSNDEIRIPEKTIDNGVHVIQSNSSINITGNLTYGNGPFTNFDTMPKLIIYAKNGINIDCMVAQIDALLIADGAVKTCADSDNVNNEKNSNQLRVNGAIIANQLVPTRTYGAGPGANSIVPAEIINFDPSLYLWGGEQREVNSVNINTNLDTVFLREQAPRV